MQGLGFSFIFFDTVYDTVLDLIISLSVEESFVTIVLAGDRMESKVRRLSLHNNSTTWPTIKMPKLRSLTIFPPAGVVIDPTPFLSRYLLLRVLDLRGCKLNDLASLRFVGNLSHLRYLGLPSTEGDGPCQLPVEIGKLRFLQTLDLYKTRVEELPPSVITGLGQLMCLRCYGWGGTRLPDGLKKLTSLEVLEGLIVTSQCIAEELGHLTQLRVLDVKVIYAEEANDDGWAAFIKAQLESLGKLTKIECLRISVNFDAAILDGSMTEPQPLGNLRKLHIGGFNDVLRMPTWIRPAWLPALSYLDIRVKHERTDDIQVLGTLPCLGHLRFSARVAAEERSAVGADAFPRLVICVFRILDTIMGPCTFPRGAMPMLQDYGAITECGR